MMHQSIAVPAILAILVMGSAQAAILRVGHGSGYEFTTITEALAAANTGDTVTVADGTYTTGGTYPEALPLVMRDGVTVIRETPDILPVIDGNGSRQVMVCENVTTGIEGFRITGGAAFDEEVNGGGMKVNQSTVTVRSCEFSANYAETNGGGVHCKSSAMTFADCRFETNGARNGGGVYAESSTTLSLTQCTFLNNTASMIGGGLHCGLYASVHISESQFEGNSAQDGAGIGCYACDLFLHNVLLSGNAATGSGGALHGHDATIDVFQSAVLNNTAANGAGFAVRESTGLTVNDSVVSGNTASQKGGGIHASDADIETLFTTVLGNTATNEGGGLFLSRAGGIIASTDVLDNSSVNGGGICADQDTGVQTVNCLLARNHATEFGGAFFIRECSPECLNCTLTNNYAADGGGAVACSNASPVFQRCILWDNDIDEVFSFSGTPVFAFCDITGGQPGTGNFNTDPRFVTGPDGSFYLSQISAGQSADSPCVNSGGVPSAGLSFTVADRTFYLDAMTTRTDEQADSGQVDVGYHYDLSRDPCIGLGCHIQMPALYFAPGDAFFCNVIIHNPETIVYPDMPVFMILDVYGTLFFAPGFSAFDAYTRTIIPGKNTLTVLPQFIWPAGCGSASGIRWYAGMTNHSMTELFGSLDTVQFGWGG
ncbi:MAG TPA: DUF1565 domain-containing protein [bacterium]|nr:DUF1565 domain-containing protein [bacterium]